MLENGGPDHGGGAREEAERDLLERREVQAHAAEEGINLYDVINGVLGPRSLCKTHEEIADGDENDEREGVKVGEDVVRDTVEDHRSSLRRQVIVQLVVGEPYNLRE